jgi:integrase
VPGLYRRTRGGKTRYYDATGKALGADKSRAVGEMLRRHAEPIGQTAGTWRHATKRYRDWMDGPACELRPKTVAGYLKALSVLDKVFGDALLDEIKPVTIGAIKREMADRQRWCNALMTVVSIVWKFAHENGLTEAPNPTREIKKFPNRARDIEVTDAMIQAVARHGDQLLRDWIALELVAGQRVSDTLELRREHIVGDELRPPNTKTGKPIRIRIDGDVKRVIDDLVSRPRKVSGPWLVQTNTGRQATYWMIQIRWDAALRKAKEADPSLPHFQRRDLRAKSATDAPDDAQARLGHTSERMTRKHYLRSTKLAAGGVLADGILDQNTDGFLTPSEGISDE